MTFTERLQRRKAEWWEAGPELWTPRGFLQCVRRQGLRNLLSGDAEVIRRRTDPDSVWRFCRYWQRTLIHKWNSREFAQKYGCRVPELYWSGRDIDQLPTGSLPHCFAIRPVFGSARDGVCVFAGELDLIRGVTVPRAGLRDYLRSIRRRNPQPMILVEEFVRSPKGECTLPIEYKFHMFGSKIAAIEAVERSGGEERFHRQLNADWNPLSAPIHTDGTLGGTFDRPDCLPEMLECVQRLGVAFGTYVRVDYYVGDKGPVFSEFSSMPGGGKHYTPFGDEYLGRLWDQVFPHKV